MALDPFENSRDCIPAPGCLQIQKKRQCQKGKDKNIGDVPQVMPAEVSLRIGMKFYDGRIKTPVRVKRNSPKNSFQVDLGRHNDKHSKDQRNKQSLYAFSRKLPGRIAPQSEPHRRSGNEEEQWHAPLSDKGHDILHRFGGLIVLDMPVPGVEHHSRVEEYQNGKRDHAKPVEIISPGHKLPPFLIPKVWPAGQRFYVFVTNSKIVGMSSLRSIMQARRLRSGPDLI